MSLNWKIARPTLWGGFLLLTAGCSGINATKSVSPIDFLLPGAGHFLRLEEAPPEMTPGPSNSFAALQPQTLFVGITQ